MMRPSMTTSVFSYSQIWILAFVCRNLKMRFCGDGEESVGGGSVSGVGWVRASDRIGDERRARALRGGREVRKGRRTIGWVMMRCTLVAMVAEFHSVTVALSG